MNGGRIFQRLFSRISMISMRHGGLVGRSPIRASKRGSRRQKPRASGTGPRLSLKVAPRPGDSSVREYLSFHGGPTGYETLSVSGH